MLSEYFFTIYISKVHKFRNPENVKLIEYLAYHKTKQNKEKDEMVINF